jgi:hypothetical protein
MLLNAQAANTDSTTTEIVSVQSIFVIWPGRAADRCCERRWKVSVAEPELTFFPTEDDFFGVR